MPGPLLYAAGYALFGGSLAALTLDETVVPTQMGDGTLPEHADEMERLIVEQVVPTMAKEALNDALMPGIVQQRTEMMALHAGTQTAGLIGQHFAENDPAVPEATLDCAVEHYTSLASQIDLTAGRFNSVPEAALTDLRESFAWGVGKSGIVDGRQVGLARCDGIPQNLWSDINEAVTSGTDSFLRDNIGIPEPRQQLAVLN